MRNFLLIVALSLSHSPAVTAQSSAAPTFETYPAAVSRMRRARLKLGGRARPYRPTLVAGYKQGVNFAGHYTLITWLCGNSCHQFAIADTRTGRVFLPGFDVACCAILTRDELTDAEPLQYRVDSRLLVVSGKLIGKGEIEGIFYYVWKGNRLQEVAHDTR